MLGFLSNMRDVKGALTAGFLLLFAVWLTFGNELSRIKSDDTLLGTVARLIAYMGPVATLGLVTFCGYLLGLVLSLDSVVLWLINHLPISRKRFLGARGKRLRQHVQDIVDRAAVQEHPYFLLDKLGDSAPLESLEPDLRRFLEQSKPLTDPGPLNPEMVDTFLSGKTRLVEVLMNRIHVSVIFLAVQLGSADEKARDRYEKAQGEAQFRASICIPLIVVAIVCGIRMNLERAPAAASWAVVLAGLVGSLALGWLAAKKEEEAREEVHNGIILGQIKVADLDALVPQKENPTIAEVID